MSTECGAWAESIDPNLDAVASRKLTSLKAAVSAVLFAISVSSVGEAAATRFRDEFQTSYAAADLAVDLQSESLSGGFCTETGCYIWANPYDPLTGGGGGGGGGSGGTGSSSGGSGPPPDPPAIPTMLLPDPAKVACGATMYGDQKPKWGFAVNNIWAFADGPVEVYSPTSSIPPTGFESDSGITASGPLWPGGGTTILYADGLSAHTSGFDYYEEGSTTRKNAPGPFSATEWAIVTFAQEIRHQNGLGSSHDEELQAEGYAYKVLTAYRKDGGKKCP